MSDLFLGLISGTSADGIDAALVEFDGGRARLRFGRTYPWDPDLRARLVALGQQEAALTLDAVAELDVSIGRAFAAAANAAKIPTSMRRPCPGKASNATSNGWH